VSSWEIELAIPTRRVICEMRQPEKVDAETFRDQTRYTRSFERLRLPRRYCLFHNGQKHYKSHQVATTATGCYVPT
jgi:hypothetical protein